MSSYYWEKTKGGKIPKLLSAYAMDLAEANKWPN